MHHYLMKKLIVIQHPRSKIIDIYARITEEVVDWIRKKTDGAKKSNCDDI